MNRNQEMVVILAGLTMCAAWPFWIWLLLSRFHAPGWLIDVACVVAFVLAGWAYLTLQKICKGE